ncbi:MAG TPA: type II toxin-antitoxin system RelE/ParE family toxin [Elusimicrobiota bacterium]|jgi:putative addiction module killer protein|nr:type II toxin-antitoxin system RelE/ParE family toxin [Elusimicrobiota bacterium]
MKRTRKVYQTAFGFSPFERRLEGLRDAVGYAKILVRLERAEHGNSGDHRSVGAGVIELRIHYGPGYRLYLGQNGEEIIVLLLAGDKSTQMRDVKRAHEYWRDYKRRA